MAKRYFNGKNGFANMPKEVIMKSYPKVDYSMNEYIDDTIVGIDEQMKADKRGVKKVKKPVKY